LPTPTKPATFATPAATEPLTSAAPAATGPGATPAAAKRAATPGAAKAAADHARLIADCHDLAHAAFATMSRSAGADLLSLDLTMGQFKAMATLTMFGPQAVGGLGRKLGLSEPAASLLVDKLEELDLAVRERDPADRRRTLVRATPKAEELAGRLREGRREHVTRMLGELTSEELAGLASGLHGILRVSAELAAGKDADHV
jgi:DNA-binding MarR family transcriptional regulator